MSDTDRVIKLRDLARASTMHIPDLMDDLKAVEKRAEAAKEDAPFALRGRLFDDCGEQLQSLFDDLGRHMALMRLALDLTGYGFEVVVKRYTDAHDELESDLKDIAKDLRSWLDEDPVFDKDKWEYLKDDG